MNIKEKLPAFISPAIYGRIQELAKLADEKNQKAVLVGGVVRDVLLERKVLDADVMLEAPVQPIVDEWAKKSKANLVAHGSFLTYTVTFGPGQKIDVVTAREENYSSPAQLPVVRSSTIEKDFQRRDFSVNAIACWLNESKFGGVLDPLSGQTDLDNKVIRALHGKSFIDDPTRIYRAARFAGRLEFRVEPQTQKWIEDAVAQKTPALLSPVRRRHEFELILKEENPGAALSLLDSWKALSFIHPEWTRLPPPLLTLLSRTPSEKEAQSLHVWRLALWFRPWGNDKAQQMMTDLAFEKDVKREVLALL